MSDALTDGLQRRVLVVDQVIDACKAVVRTLVGEPSDQSETDLSRSMVTLRDLLIEMRDAIGLDRGPAVEVDGQSINAYTGFVDGFHAIAQTCMKIQAARHRDFDWSEAREEAGQLRVDVGCLLHFLAVAYATQTGTSLATAKHQLQTILDRRKIGAHPNPADTKSLTRSDEDRYEIGQIVYEHRTEKRDTTWPMIVEAVRDKGYGDISVSTLDRYLGYYCKQVGLKKPPQKRSGAPKKRTQPTWQSPMTESGRL